MNQTNNILICGPSSVGKDTVARSLFNLLEEKHYKANLVISNTTRPMRKNEKQDVDYHFCRTQKEFDEYQYLEQTNFRGWRYGVPAQNLKEGYYNILVLNPKGIQSSIGLLKNYIIVYLHENFLVRFIRSIKREKSFKFEMLRRAVTDTFDFWNFEKFLKENNINYFKIKNKNSSYSVSLIKYYLTFSSK